MLPALFCILQLRDASLIVRWLQRMKPEHEVWKFTAASDCDRKAKAETKKNPNQTKIQLRQNYFFYELGNYFEPAVSGVNYTLVN